jgi:hypothetical protein
MSAVRAGYHRSSELVSFMQGCLGLVGCYVCRLAIGWSRGMEHVLSPGRLPQVIKIDKFHAWLLSAYDWWDVMCAILLLAGGGGAGDPCL